MTSAPARSIVRVVLGVVSLVASLVLVAMGFVMLVADAGQSSGPRELIRPLSVLAGGGALMAVGIAVLIWEMSIRYDIRR